MTRALSLVPLLLLGCQDKVLTRVSATPVVQITAPTPGTTFFEEEEIVFTATVDVDGENVDLSTLTHSWTAGNLSLCDGLYVEEDGTATCVASIDTSGEYTVQINVRNDGETASDTTSVEILYNEAPTVTMTAPVDGETFSPEGLVVFEATVSDNEDEANELTVAVNSSIDGDLKLDGTPSTGGDWSGGAYLSEGTHLIKLTVYDSSNKTGQDSATIRINTAPGSPAIQILPQDPISGQSLVAEIVEEATDADNDPITYDYEWYVDGKLYLTGVPTIAENVIQRGEYWELKVSANDGTSNGPADTDSVQVGNSLPSIDSVSMDPSSPTTEDTVTALPQSWDDPEGDPEQYRYVWYQNGSLAPAETTDSYPYSSTTRGDELRVEVTPYDDYGDGDTVSSSTIEIKNSPPTSPSIAIDPSSPEPEDSLYCDRLSDSTDADGDSITYSYTWLQNGTTAGIYTNVVEASYTDNGDVWECQVIPNDGVENGIAATDSVTISDVSAPDAPIIDTPDAFRNEDEITLTGTCEADCDLTFYFNDSTGSWTDTDTCDSVGSFEFYETLTEGDSTEVYVTCEDSSGNVSGDSNTVSTEVCGDTDVYELTSEGYSAGYGDSYSLPVNEWSAMPDDASISISIIGNILDSSDEDWYLVSILDDVSADTSAGIDYNYLHIEMDAGSSNYYIDVYDGDPATTLAYCSELDELEFKNQDVGDGTHSIPSDSRYCGSSSLYNECTDYSDDWYVEVYRKSSTISSCDYYELSITNGVW